MFPLYTVAREPFEKTLYPKDVLENVQLEFKGNGLEVSWKRKISEQPEFEYWEKALGDLQNWMEVRCNVHDDYADISWNAN